MMKLISTFCFALICMQGLAQKSDTSIRYFNARLEPVTKNSAAYAGIVSPENNKWMLVIMNDSAKKIITGYYKDKGLKVKDGWFTYFYPNGIPHFRGIYKNNEQDGIWLSWYPGGERKDSIYFTNGMKHGPSFSWFDNGNLKYSGQYFSSFADSTWSWYHENGKPATREKYDGGRLKSLECFDTLGNYSGMGCSIETVPSIKGYYGGLNKYIIDSLYYPEEALKKNIQGVVEVKFNITKQGRLDTIAIVSSPDDLLSKEVVRVLKSVPAWYPAIEHNRPIEYSQTLRIPFYKAGNVPFN